MDSKSEDYKVITGDHARVQKVLNQWKHEFLLEVISMCVDNGVLYVLVVRRRRNIRVSY